MNARISNLAHKAAELLRAILNLADEEAGDTSLDLDSIAR